MEVHVVFHMFSFSIFNYLSEVTQITMLLIESSLTNVNFQGRTGIFFLNDIFSCQGRLVCQQDTGREKVSCGQLWSTLRHIYSMVFLSDVFFFRSLVPSLI